MALKEQGRGIEKESASPRHEAGPGNIETLLKRIHNTTFVVFRPPAGDNPGIRRALANTIITQLSPYYEIHSNPISKEAGNTPTWTATALKHVINQIARGGFHFDSRKLTRHTLYIWEGMVPFNPDVIGALYPEIAGVIDAIEKGVPLEKVLAQIQAGKYPTYALNLLEMFFGVPIGEYASSRLQGLEAKRTYPIVPFWILHCPRCGSDFSQLVAKQIKGDYLPPLNPDTLRGTYATMIQAIKQNAANRFSRLYPKGAKIKTGWNTLPEYTRGNAQPDVEEFSIDAAVHCPNSREEFVEQMRRVMEGLG